MIRSTSISLSKRSNLIRSLSSFIIDKSHKPTGKRSSDVIKNKDGKDRIILFGMFIYRIYMIYLFI